MKKNRSFSSIFFSAFSEFLIIFIAVSVGVSFRPLDVGGIWGFVFVLLTLSVAISLKELSKEF